MPRRLAHLRGEALASHVETLEAAVDPISVMILGLAGAALPVSEASASRDRVAEPNANLVSPGPERWGKADFGAFCRTLKRALVRRDVAAMALLIEYPLRFNQGDGGTITIENARALETHFDEIF